MRRNDNINIPLRRALTVSHPLHNALQKTQPPVNGFFTAVAAPERTGIPMANEEPHIPAHPQKGCQAMLGLVIP